MEKIYRVVMVYPDGHVEDVQEEFKEGKEALEYGNNLLGQVYNTESVSRSSNSGIDDGFGFKEKIDPYFMIVEVRGKKIRMVYDSHFR